MTVGKSRVAAVAIVGLTALVGVGGPAWAQDFSNATPISVALPGPPPGCPSPTGCPSEQATPFPSNIAVSNLTGTVSDVNVVLRDLTYPLKPADIDIMVVAPGGTAVMLMSDACGDNSETNENPITSAITLTFDDQAAAALPIDGVCSSGSFRPVDDDDDADEFSAHLHADDVLPGGPNPPNVTALSTFNGIDPNGTWSLYLVDDGPNNPNPAGNAGRIASGWTLAVTTAGPVGAPAAPAVTTTTRPALGSATTTTTRPALGSATTTTTRPATAVGTTTTTKPNLPVSGSRSGPMVVLGGLLMIAGATMVKKSPRQMATVGRGRRPTARSWH